jgi:uncharacterized protein (UPF0332 family)
MIDKASAHLQAAEILFQHRHYHDVLSRAYYAAFSAMYAFVGDPPRGRWEHPGLRGVFIRKLSERGTPIDGCRELRKRLRYLLDAREVADYRQEEVDEEIAIDALQIAREALRVVEEYAI